MTMAKRRPPMQFDLSGFPAIHKVLKELGKQHGNTVERRLARAALGAGLTEAARDAYRRYADTYPDSHVAGKARARAEAV